MFKVGDKILYPMNGAGIIEDIEEQKICGEKKSYYIMTMASGGMKAMIPADTCENIGVRYIISREDGAKVLEQFRKEPLIADDNWNKRHRDNMERIRSGDIFKVLGVVKNLMYMDKKKGLSTSERKMLGVAKQILISELVMTGVAGKSDIESIMEDTIEELVNKR